MSNSVTQTKSLPFANNFNIDEIKGKVDDLEQTAIGGVCSKFKGHASKVMTRPGAKTQALGATGLILGGLAATGLLATITAALGVTCPPAAAGVLLVGGAILLGIGSYKVYKHAKDVVSQKSAEKNQQISGNNQQKPENNQGIRKRDIALEFVKQTAENIIFGVPTILVQVIPEVREKLEACSEKYEAKQSIKEGASTISEQIGNLQNLQTNITDGIANIQTQVNNKISIAEEEITQIVNGKTKEILDKQINELQPYKEQLEKINTLQEAFQNPLEHLKDLQDLKIISKDYLEGIREIALKQAKDLNLGDNIKTKLEDAKDINELIALERKIQEKAKQQNLSIDLQIQSNATKLETNLKKKINSELTTLESKLPQNLNLGELQQTLENTQAALDSLSDSKGKLTDAAKTILQNSKDEAKKACQDQINNIKTRLKNEVKTIITQQQETISKTIQNQLPGIEREINGAFKLLENSIESTDLDANTVESLKTHAQQTLKKFDISNIIEPWEKQISDNIELFDFENNLDLTNVFKDTIGNVNNLTTSLAKDITEIFLQAGIQEAKQVGARKIEAGMKQITTEFSKQLGLNNENLATKSNG